MLAAALVSSAAGAYEDLLRLQQSADAMGATFSIILYGGQREKMEAALNSAFVELRRLDSMLSNYNPASEWSAVNRSAAQRPVEVTPELFRLLSDALEYSRQSEGAFDISVAPLMKAWGFYRGPGQLPRPDEVTRALDQVGYGHLHLDPARRTVWFDRPGVEIDPGGIGKGYAVDRMAETLRQAGFTRALVTASGSSIYGMGAPPAEPMGWRVNISDPRDHRRSIAEVFLKDLSMSTSGSYEKRFRAGGRTYSHIMDPRTGYPAQGTSLATVVAPRTIDGEAWAKPYFIQGRAWAVEHRRKEFRVFLCEDRPGSACGWLP